jgi:hypothetical protein
MTNANAVMLIANLPPASKADAQRPSLNSEPAALTSVRVPSDKQQQPLVQEMQVRSEQHSRVSSKNNASAAPTPNEQTGISNLLDFTQLQQLATQLQQSFLQFHNPIGMPFNPLLNPLLTQQFATIPQMQNPYLQYGQMHNIQQAMLPFQQAFQPFQQAFQQPNHEQTSQSSQQLRRQSQHDVDMQQQQPQLES